MRTSGAIVCSGVIDGTSIVSANVFFALSNSSTNTPADTAFTYDNFPPLNAGNYVWQATKITDSDGKTSLTGKICLGPTTDFLSGTEVYAISTSNSTAPAENTTNWKTTYEKTKGYYLWTATRVQYTNGNYAYLNKKCVGYWGEDGKGISSADIMFCLGDSQTQAPGDSSFTVTTFAGLNISSTDANKFVWQCIKTTYTSGDPTYSGKVCLGKVSDFASVVEQYALGSASAATGSWRDNTPPSAEKGKYLWTRTKLTYSGGGTTYIPSEAGQCVGYFGNDGATGYSIALTLIRNNLYTDANWNTYAELGHSENYSKRTGDSDFTACRVSDYFVVTGTSSDSGKNHTAIYKCTSVNANSITGTCVSHTKDGEKGDDAQYIYLKGSAFNKDSAGTNVAASEIKVNGGSNLATQRRGLCLVTLNRQTLAVVDSATIYDTYKGTTGKNNLITKLNNLGTNVFVCLVSYDAIGWSDTLISTLQSFGMSDLPYTSANRYPFLFIGYKNLGKGNGITRMNDMEEPAIPVELGVYVANGALSVKDGKDGEDGDDAVTYDIVLNTAWAKVDSSGAITAGLAGTAYKIVGSTRSVLTSTTIRHGYILNDSETYADITTDGSGNFDAGTWFNGDYQNDYAKGSNSIFAAIVIGGSVKCVKYVTIANQGDKGATGRMYYIAGKFPEKAPYTRTAKLCPVVYYSPYWWYLDADSATGSDTPSDSNSSKWKKLENYGVVLTDAIFVKNFAQFGAAIITGDWLISVHGTINGVYYGGSVEAPGEYNNRAAYTYFDPAYPMGFESFQIPVKTEEIDKGYSTEWIRITNNFSLTAGTYIIKITCHVNSSDTMHLRLFDDNDSSDAYYLGSTTSDEVVTLVYTKTITTGSSKFNLRAGMNANGEIGYIDSIEIESTDARFVPNYAVDLRTGRTYQNDANIRGKIVTIGPSSKVEISDGVIKLYGAYNFPNIVLGVDANGCAVLNFYDKNGMFTYGLGPIEAERTQSQAESFTLQYYNIDDGSYDATEIPNSAIVTVYRYMFKSQVPPSSTFLKKYLAKIMANAYFGGNYCASGEEARYFNGKFIKASYHSPFQTGDVYGGGIVVTCNNPQSGIISSKETMLNGRSIEELELRNYNVMQDSDYNRTKEGDVYYYNTKDPYSPVQAFWLDTSAGGGKGYGSGYTWFGYINLIVDPTDWNEDKLADPIYWFNLQYIDSKGVGSYKTLYINKSKLQAILQNAGYSL